MPVKGSYLLVAGGGAIVLWSGIRGHKWSSVLRDIISGKQLPTSPELGITSSAASATGGGASAGATGASTAAGGSKAKNLAIGGTLATVYGWGPGTTNWKALVALWDQESEWNNHAKNPTSGAYGIPQALPANKMGALANPPTSSAGAQIAWGLKYIKSTYGNPVNAEAHEQSEGWY
jgi:resuscitation-promoting factor RpfB